MSSKPSRTKFFQPMGKGQVPPIRFESENSATRTLRVLMAFSMLAVVFLCIYVVFRDLAIFNSGYNPVDYIFAVALIISELFIAVHAVGYFWAVFRASVRANTARTEVFTGFANPPVAVYLATYNEPEEIIEDTLASLLGLEYPNLQIYLNCDSPKAAQAQMAEALAKKYRVNFYHRVPNTGYKAGGINLFLGRLGKDLPYAKYMIVLDADSKPVRTFASELVAIAEKNPKIAFIQTPQYYGNTADSPVAMGASASQSVFYEYICEAKAESKAMICCGTNVLFRVEALLSVGGFDESSVTEDFATSLRLHSNGWESHYHNAVYVMGVGPETMGAYFVQQMRWAIGTFGIFLRGVLPRLFKPNLTFGQKFEYFLSGSYYFVGVTQMIQLICPVAFLLFGVKPLIANPVAYLVAFVPNLVFSNILFYFSMKQRDYRMKSLIASQAINFITFWVYARAVWGALLNKRISFGVTPKGQGEPLPWIVFWPQLLFMAASLVAAIVGIYHLATTGDLPLIFNIFWALYHTTLLSSIFYFNRRVTLGQPEYFFDRYA
ncbi:MAG: glycosyltransferase [Chloroflexi bacterium]|mgnify:CR=1 FL=1|nr:glycosyltransferase [Chloroflexota bacterium]